MVQVDYRYKVKDDYKVNNDYKVKYDSHKGKDDC